MVREVHWYALTDQKTEQRRERIWAPVRLAHLTFKRVLALLTLGVTVAGLYHFYWPLIDPPEKEPMTGDLNVAVAGFAATGETSEEDARAMSDSLFRALREQLSIRGSPEAPLDIQVAGPAEVGSIDQSRDSERTAEAREVGSQLHADVLIYGVVHTWDGGIEVAPEFYFPSSHVRHPEDREPLLGVVSLPPPPAGREPLGVIREPGALAAGVTARSRLRARLVQRARAFALFIVGLGQYTDALAQQAQGREARAHLLAAQRSFRSAQATRQWDPRTAHVLQLFLGNVALNLQQWRGAERAYAAALTARPDYLRARYGLAEARFHRSSGECSGGSTDARGVVAARAGYSGVVAAAASSPSLLRSKAQFGLGRAALCLGLLGRTGQLDAAEAAFAGVVADHRGGTLKLGGLAAGAYGGLGLTLISRDDPPLREAAAAFEQAISLSAPGPARAAFHSFLGFTHAALGHREAAAADYRRAARLDPQNRQQYEQEARRVLGR